MVGIHCHQIDLTILSHIHQHTGRVAHSHHGHIHRMAAHLHITFHGNHLHATSRSRHRFGSHLVLHHVLGQVAHRQVLSAAYNLVVVHLLVVVLIDSIAYHVAVTIVDEVGSMAVHRAAGSMVGFTLIGLAGLDALNLHLVLAVEGRFLSRCRGMGCRNDSGVRGLFRLAGCFRRLFLGWFGSRSRLGLGLGCSSRGSLH